MLSLILAMSLKLKIVCFEIWSMLNIIIVYICYIIYKIGIVGVFGEELLRLDGRGFELFLMASNNIGRILFFSMIFRNFASFAARL